MLAYIGTPGPWQVIILGMMVLLLFGRQLPAVLRRLAAYVPPARAARPWTLNGLLQLLASIALLVAAHVLVNPAVAIVFAGVLAAVVIATSSGQSGR